MTALLFALAAEISHDENVSSSEIEVKGRSVIWRVDVGRQGLDRVMTFPADQVDLTERQLQSVKGDVARYLLSCITLEINGEAFVPEIGPLEPMYEKYAGVGDDYISRVRQEFRFQASTEVTSLRLGIRFFADITQRHRAVITAIWDDRDRQFVLLGPAEISLRRELVDTRFFNTLYQFIKWGAHHIFIGFDHIAFLLALLLGATRLRDVVKIVTSFTVAHSITLLLSALDLIRLDRRITESLIAASIVYVAVENCIVKEPKLRWILTFGFGLIHGLGFSEQLRELLLQPDSLLLPVLSFNLGVEVGQLAILMVAWPLLTAIRGRDEIHQRRLTRIASAAIFLFGLAWLIDRVFALGFMPI